jgi:hypothetical protein
MKWKG